MSPCGHARMRTGVHEHVGLCLRHAGMGPCSVHEGGRVMGGRVVGGRVVGGCAGGCVGGQAAGSWACGGRACGKQACGEHGRIQQATYWN